jgi:uncharacterized membrane protein
MHAKMKSGSALLVASAFATAIGLAAATQAQTPPSDKEKCYGISEAGKNDCASTGNNTCAGTSKVDYDKGAWKLVNKGTCVSVEVTLKDGTKRKGSLEPIKG